MRIEYAGSVHDEEEIEAVVEVLRGGATALRIGKQTRAMEALVAESFGKARGVMCNSGSSALYLAIELLGLEEGDEIITSPLTFSTDIAPMVRGRLTPVFVDVTPDSYQIDVEAIERNIGARTRAILAPNLTGNCPDWDGIRAIADRHGLQVIEDSCDCLGATLKGSPTGTRSDISVTSFALSHIITAAGTGGMVLMDDEALADRCLLLRRWGRRSEPQLFGSKKGRERRFFSDLGGFKSFVFRPERRDFDDVFFAVSVDSDVVSSCDFSFESAALPTATRGSAFPGLSSAPSGAPADFSASSAGSFDASSAGESPLSAAGRASVAEGLASAANGWASAADGWASGSADPG